MAGPKYTLNRAAFREHLLNAPWMVELMKQRAEAGKAYAVSGAPDAPPYGGGYIASFEGESGTQGGVNHDRAYAILRNTDYKAHWIEHGTERMPAHHVLISAMDVMGGWEA